jgi:hypothetical protein
VGNGGPSDPKLAGELAVVTMLRRAAPDPTVTRLDDDARARIRAKVLTAATAPQPEPRPRPRRRLGIIPTAGPRGRLLVAFGALFCLIVALSGMAMLVSENAVPGDALYGVRKAAESAAVGLTMGEQARGEKHLQFAADRVSDLDALIAQHPDPNSGPVGDYLTAFADFDTDASAGSTDLTDFGAGNAPNVLTGLRGWAGNQGDRIAALNVGLPASAKAADARSVALLSRIEQRTTALLARTSCYTVTSGITDDIGVLPATGACDRQSGGTASTSTAMSGNPGQLDQHPGYTGPTGAITPTGQNGSSDTFGAPHTFQPGVVAGTPAPGTTAAPTTTTTTNPLPPLPTLSLPTLLPGG